jgi:catechol 2,3-dioxygenase-like lactoylglutathione lyase family enzyme
MVDIQQVDHVGIRIRHKERSVTFYEQFEFGALRALFVRDPDGTVIEFDERGDSAAEKPADDLSGYADHP